MYLKGLTATEIAENVLRMGIKDDDTLLIMIGEKNRPDIAQLIHLLNINNVDFFGGIFPGLLYNDEHYDEGTIITVLPTVEKPYLIKNINTGKFELPTWQMTTKDLEKKYTAMILVDGLAPNISSLLSAVFNQLGNSVSYFGGGAGSLTLKQEPCIFTSEGIFQDAAIVTFIRLESRLGVRHGWKYVAGPIVATKTNKNAIVELNWKKAFEVYREIVEKEAGTTLTVNNFFETARGYPFGMLKEGSESIVRDPIIVDQQGEIICVGEVPPNTVLGVLKGTKESLINAAALAVDDCSDASEKKIRVNIIIDCITRALFLDRDFKQELVTVKNKVNSFSGDQLIVGALTLGEISSYGEGFLEFFNKTIVVGMLYE